jgi:hypothetical protein
MTAVAEDVLDEEEMVARSRNLLVVEEDFLVEEEEEILPIGIFRGNRRFPFGYYR